MIRKKELLKRIDELETLGRNRSEVQNEMFSIITELSRAISPKKKVLHFVNKSPNPNPEYAKPCDSGFDIRAWVDAGTDGVQFDEKGYYVEIQPNEVKLIHTGLYLDIPEFCEIQVRPRSGYALKVGLTVNNSPGTVNYLCY